MSVSLHIESSFNAAWETVLWPWFEKVLPETWKNPLPSLVVVPTRGQVNDLKARLIAKGATYLGLQFVTPASLRALLARSIGTPRTEPEHLRLLLALAATDVEKRPNESETLAAKSVARSPAPLLNTLNRLKNAGWKFDQLAMPSFLPVVQRFKELCAQCNFVLPAEADRRDLKSAKASDLKFANVLVTGFDGAHWPHWFLLRAAIQLAENATVVLEEPRGGLSETDLCWIGSWEEIGGEAKRATSSAPSLADSLFSEAEMRGGAQKTAEFDFLIGTNVSEQAEAITWQCVRYLSDDTCTRLGVVFPSGGALSRLVSTSLARLDIPHNDGLAHIVPGIFESAEWQAWIELQRAPGLSSFLRFLNALTDPAVVFSKISRQNLEDVLRESYSELLIEDLEILREFSLKHACEKFRLAGDALGTFPFLPAQATLSQFLEQTYIALTHLGWKQHALEIATASHDWPQRFETNFSRSLFLRWLEEITSTFRTARSTEGDHPYARVQLLPVTHAQGQQWSHLIFAGWNDGAWPPPPTAEFARTEEISAFNRAVQLLNKRAARQGRQGEGHTSVRENHSLYLGPNEQRSIALRQFNTLLESVSEGVTLAASLVQEGEPERFWNPSELFTQIYLETTQRPLTQKVMRELQAHTHNWLEKSADPTSEKRAAPKEVQQTRVAYDQRRDVTAKSDIYDFAFPSKPNRAAIFSVSEFDRFISAPALVWMKHYLGVKAVGDDAHIWAASSGGWIHDWLKQVAEAGEKTFSQLPDAIEIDRRIVVAAKAKRAEIEALCERVAKPLPDWWRSGWQNALFFARVLGERLSTVTDWPCMATEWEIEQDIPVQINDQATLTFRGRIDLILAREKLAPESLTTDELWLIDYKTGAKKALRLPLKKRLLDGTALQLSLYALAVHTRGTERALISILSPLVRPLEPQLESSDLATEQEVFLELARMQQSGVFGMHGPLRGAFRFTEDYPLATIGIDQDTLEQRWENTHPPLVRDDEEFFW